MITMIAKLPTLFFCLVIPAKAGTHLYFSSPLRGESRVRVKCKGSIHRTRNEDGSDKSDPYKKKNADFTKENIK